MRVRVRVHSARETRKTNLSDVFAEAVFAGLKRQKDVRYRVV